MPLRRGLHLPALDRGISDPCVLRSRSGTGAQSRWSAFGRGDFTIRTQMFPNAQTCNPDLSLPSWLVEIAERNAGRPLYGPGASQDDVPPPAAPLQGPLPPIYRSLTEEELRRRIASAKRRLGDRLVILGHHYQRDEIIRFADYRGDSYKLARLAAARRDAEFIVFCGVHFMAESAEILSAEQQVVVLPNMAAGCSMADMARADDLLACWDRLDALFRPDGGASPRLPVVPITYMNSSAGVKSFCGNHGGAVCTSSNAVDVVAWGLEQGERILFLPDEHLGRNTAMALGFGEEDLVIWDPARPFGGVEPEKLRRARFILWRGWCSVHMRFTTEQIEQARDEDHGIMIAVHPECRHEVVSAADHVGSTEQICALIRSAPAGSRWGVGTEINLVHRLAEEMPEKSIRCLDPIVCPCSTMYRIHPAYLCWAIESLADGEIVNRIRVEPEIAEGARLALDRMVAIAEARHV